MLIGIDASRVTVTQRTGTEAYATFLIRALLARTADTTHRLRLYFNQAPEPGLFPDYPHAEIRIMPQRRLWTHLRLARELRQSPPDVFFTPAHVVPFTYSGSAVATVHDLGYHYFPEAHTRSQVAYLKLSTRSNCRLSDHVIADSEATKLDLMRFYGTSAEKISVVYPGTDPAIRAVEDVGFVAAVCARYGIKQPYLLHLGTLQPRKNLDRLVQAYARSGVPSQLVLGGKMGWQTDSIRQTIMDLDERQQARVLLPGYVAEEDKAALLSGAEALVFPSLYEGFGFPLLEAQACNTPVLTSNSSSLPEVAGSAALFVDPLKTEEITRGIQRIVGDETLRADLIRKGQSNVRRFDWAITADAVLDLLLTAQQNQLTGSGP